MSTITYATSTERHSRWRNALLSLLLLLLPVSVWAAEDYPARCRTTTDLNVREGAGTSWPRMGTLPKGTEVIVNGVRVYDGRSWGSIDYRGRTGYISLRYVTYIAPVAVQESPPADDEQKSSLWDRLQPFWGDFWDVVVTILEVAAVLLLLIFLREILFVIAYLGFFVGIGALVGAIFFDSGSVGAVVGLAIGVLMGLRQLVENFGEEAAGIMSILYYIVSFPLYVTNSLEHILVSPWRYFIKSSWIDDNAKPAVRAILEVLTVLLYIAITPLRLFNAIMYNMVVHCVTVIYDLLYEVAVPSDYDEGKSDFGRWLLMLPWRFVKYPLYHGALTVIESAIWTVVDIFVPAITMYHGTDLPAANAIVRDTHRNKHLRHTSRRTEGNFMASQSSWGGIGVYFAPQRSVAKGYATDPYRLSDSNPVIIVCRVSLGRVINYALAPYSVYCEAGGHGKPAVINLYCEQNGYTTGEWWNSGAGYWEYCMLDWQNGYNHPWRIRPIYVFNLRTGIAQHIDGGMQHWLFYHKVIDSLKRDLDL